MAPETGNELILLSDALLSRFGQDIEIGDGVVRCVVLSGFFVATYTEAPELAIYRILQLDNERNIWPLFAAARHSGSGLIDVRLHRDDHWKKTFRRLVLDVIDLDSSENSH